MHKTSQKIERVKVVGTAITVGQLARIDKERAARGAPVSRSQWIREAVAEKLEREPSELRRAGVRK